MEVYAFAGLVVAVLGVLVTVWGNYRQSQRKELSVRPVTLNLIDLDSEVKAKVKDKLRVFWGERVIRKLDITEITIACFSKAISKEDFKSPLKISFDDANILSAEITHKNPDNMEISESHAESQMLITFPLINKGESFSIKVVTDGLKNPSAVIAEARIINGMVVNKNVPNTKKKLIKKCVDLIDWIASYAFIPIGVLIFYWLFGGQFGFHWNWEIIKPFILFMGKLFLVVIISGVIILVPLGFLRRWLSDKAE